MKPAPFAYVAPESLTAVLHSLAEHGDEAKLLAGGQSLIPAMNFRLARPSVLVDVNRLDDLAFIRANGNLKIGAMTRQHQLETNPLIAQHDPLLHEMMPHIAHPQIRNRGTMGGSLAHADPAAELPVYAVARQARLRVRSVSSDRWVAADDFFQGLFATALAPEEMVTEVAIPMLPARTGTAFVEMARRHGDYALAGVAVIVTLDASGMCEAARIVCLNVGEVPMVAHQAASTLVGERPSADVIQAAAETAAAHEIDPAGDVHASAAYKRHLIKVLTRRALGVAIDRAKRAD
ncbi:MAG: xanthine dehydrogenase family protein subunit M [Chloroflexota bacterium]